MMGGPPVSRCFELRNHFFMRRKLPVLARKSTAELVKAHSQPPK
eukprot:CAMPEP_0204177566 /NCGR_PEP_ID=MMETSP0361-20130328/48586_1 /ASSEMBLY_ACC=CAM_ASM_000343 /TAXON_ID=268821 /ORGANISM="Scrippsiella Hangoei, Strain SHTV-5" /LENGTH=43 /DNA_ID= /DNA_START= /DNA_END= /DNA_ORIENTATION=